MPLWSGLLMLSEPKNSPALSLRATELAYGGIKAYERAKADGLTKLDFEPWLVARTTEFKDWFGDWERGRALRFLETERVVLVLKGNELDSSLSFRGLVETVFEDYKNQDSLEIFVRGVGPVSLDRRAIQNSRGHGDRSERLVAFLAVPTILRKGMLIDSRPMRDERMGSFSHIAAPIQISGAQYIAVVQVKNPPETGSRMFTHQVFLKEKLQQPLYIRAAGAGKTAEQTSGQRGTGVAEILLRDIYAVNLNSVSKESDRETQEPLPEAIDAFLSLMRAQGVTVSSVESPSASLSLSPRSETLIQLAKSARKVARSAASEEVKAQAITRLREGIEAITGPGLTAIPLKRILVAFALRQCSERHLIKAAFEHDQAIERRAELTRRKDQDLGHSFEIDL